MFTLQGDFGKTIFATSQDSSGAVNSRYLKLEQTQSLIFFKKLSILKTNLLLNSFGLFTFQRGNKEGKVRFATMSTPKHLLSSVSKNCAFDPKGNVQIGVEEFDMCAIQYHGKQCPDGMLGDCMRELLGSGRKVRDVMDTPQGRAFFNMIIQSIYEGLGNSFYELAWFGQHPLIEESHNNSWYTQSGVEDDVWADYVDQQKACGGFMTMIDKLKEKGHTNYNVTINRSDISNDGMHYTGSAKALFDRVINAQNPALKIASKNSRSSNASAGGKAPILVSAPIFRKYEEELQAEFPHIPQMFQYFYNGEFCKAAGCDVDNAVPGTLRYNGHLIVCMDEWDDFDDTVGVKTFRALLICPGNLGLGFDVPNLQQFSGMGMKITQHLEDPWMGQVFMSTTFRVGMGIINPDYIVNACLVLKPTA